MKASLFFLLFLVSGLLLSGCGGKKNGQTAPDQSNQTNQNGGGMIFKLVPLSGKFISPVFLTHAGDGSGRHFVVEQPGRIVIIREGKLLPEPFLDLTDRVVPLNKGYAEMGLLGLAFHPDYKNNGRFFVYYSAPSNKKDSDHQSILAEYKVSAGSPDKAEVNEKRLMAIEQPEFNHNGGCLAFGPDGMLYLGLGDGGGGGDQHGTIGNGQDPETLLGSIIRLDVNKTSGNAPFAIPADNPFVNKPGRDEIHAYGLRNPWRFSFDRKTGQLFCADVGQDTYEEVNIIKKGRNYGWRALEGFHAYDEKLKNPLKTDFVPPIAEYDHAVGNSVTGGYVYRGKQFPAMEGKYFFGDWSGQLFYLEQMGAEWVRKSLPLEDSEDGKVDFKVNSFGEDENGEIYVLGQKKVGGNSSTGLVYQLTLVSQSDKQVGMK